MADSPKATAAEQAPAEVAAAQEPAQEELMPGVALQRTASTSEPSGDPPEFKQWVRFKWEGFEASTGRRFAPEREVWTKIGDGDVPPGKPNAPWDCVRHVRRCGNTFKLSGACPHVHCLRVDVPD